MKREFEINITGRLSFFLSLQIKQTKDHIDIHRTKYAREFLKLRTCKEMKTTKHTSYNTNQNCRPHSV